MKKLIYRGLFLALVGMMFVGCKKEKIARKTTNNDVAMSNRSSKDFSTDNSTEKSIIGRTKKWYDNGGSDYGCKTGKGNCYA